MNNITKFFRLFFPEPKITVIKRENITSDDRGYARQFVTSPECNAIEKHLRIRIIQRMETASNKDTKPEERIEAIAKKDELIDVLQEWSNIRADLTDENSEASS